MAFEEIGSAAELRDLLGTPSGRIRDISEPWTSSVRNSLSGSTPLSGGIHLRSIASVPGS